MHKSEETSFHVLVIRDLSRAGLLQICSDFIAISKAAPKLECIPNPPLHRLEHVLKLPGERLESSNRCLWNTNKTVK